MYVCLPWKHNKAQSILQELDLPVAIFFPAWNQPQKKSLPTPTSGLPASSEHTETQQQAE